MATLAGQLSKTSTARANSSQKPGVTNLITSLSTESSLRMSRAGLSNEWTAVSFGAAARRTASISFGAVPAIKKANPSGTSEWANLLKTTASGGIASALGGNLMSAVGGVGGLVSSLVHLFSGSKKSTPALTAFELPESRSESVVYQSAISSESVSGTRTGVYGSVQDTTGPGSHDQTYQFQSQQIAQAVKQALLNSSSLNDVIAEI